MRKFTNPLDNIHVASPCSANWDEMFGDDRKRHCGDCKLNVYNLSNMTRREAEDLLVNSEGRLCVRFFRRADGTVLTKNCPVGWQAVKRRMSRIATAAFSMVAGIFGGIFAFNLFKSQPYNETIGVKRTLPPPAMGDVALPSVNTVDVNGRWANGGMTMGKMADPQMVKPNRK